MTSHTLDNNPEQVAIMPRKTLEEAARTDLNAQAGRTLTDAEWARARTPLLEFVTILRGWSRRTHAPKDSGANDVVTIDRTATEKYALQEAA